MQKLLSVIIPVYKVEKYINKCLDSLILPQEQLDLLDVVIINDGTAAVLPQISQLLFNCKHNNN